MSIYVSLVGTHQDAELKLGLRAPRSGSIPPGDVEAIELALLKEWDQRVSTAVTVGPLLMVVSAVERR